MPLHLKVYNYDIYYILITIMIYYLGEDLELQNEFDKVFGPVFQSLDSNERTEFLKMITAVNEQGLLSILIFFIANIIII